MAQKFKQGDKVEWQAGQGTTIGTVQRRVTESTEVDGHAVDASEADPRYLVKNDHTGTVTGHKPETLSPAGDRDGKDQKAKQNSGQGKGLEFSDEVQEKIQEFKEAVNMTAHEIENWLGTDESKSVGWENDSGEIIGRQSGKHIVEILRKNKANYTEDDYQRMKKVVSYVHRHLAQEPSGDVEDTRWRYSLMNWGHDPLKDTTR
jgi:hypothetical protein